MFIKIDDPDVWVPKHRYVWEQEHGEIPENKVILFKDGNTLDCRIENLFVVDRVVMLVAGRKGLRNEYPELNVIGHRIAELELLTKRRELEG